MPTRAQFLEGFEYAIDPEFDFEVDGQKAEWASGHPKEWGQEMDSIKLPHVDQDIRYAHARADISPDNKLLAVSWYNQVLIYDIESKELRQTLDGTSTVCFRPDGRQPSESQSHGALDTDSPRFYTVLTYVPTAVEWGLRAKPATDLILYELDRHGRLFHEDERLDASALARKAVQSITTELEKQHEWSPALIASMSPGFEKALKSAEQQHRAEHHTVLKDATASKPSFSPDGARLLYRTKNTTTQHGMRGADELPQVVVWDLDAGKELHRLRGHTDNIIWARYSPNGEYIATVSWDGTMRMYVALSGVLRWATESCHRQSWCAAFSPDSSAIVYSSSGGMVVEVHDVLDGKTLARFPVELKRWVREMKWHPSGRRIAFASEGTVFVWRPFDGVGEDTIAQEVKLVVEESGLRHFVSFKQIAWLEDGCKLAVTSSDGSILIWHSKTNAKELFRRPKGRQIASCDADIRLIPDEQGDYYVSLDGDEHVRFWRTSVPASPSWWEKAQSKGLDKIRQQEEKNELPYPETENKDQGSQSERKEKPPYPPTGKYVKITKLPSVKAKDKDESNRDTWASSGAELWTAE